MQKQLAEKLLRATAAVSFFLSNSCHVQHVQLLIDMRQSMQTMSPISQQPQKSCAHSTVDFQMHTVDNIRNHADGMIVVGRVLKTNAVVQVCVPHKSKQIMSNLPKKNLFFCNASFNAVKKIICADLCKAQQHAQHAFMNSNDATHIGFSNANNDSHSHKRRANW